MANENWTVKPVEADDQKSAQETEAAVLEQAVEAGDVAPEYGVEKDGVVKINLDEPQKPKEDAKEADADAGGVEPVAETTTTSQEQEEVPTEAEAPKGGLELVEEKEDTGVKAAEAKPVAHQNEPVVEQPKLPENVEKLVAFMEDTGGSIEDYAKLNRDIDSLDDVSTIKEYYREKYPHMSEERLARKMDKSFLYDEDGDEPDIIQDKKDLFEDELFEAKKYLKGRKDKYYAELKLSKSANLDPEVREAVDYYQQQQAQAETNQKLVQTFKERTDQVFNPEFKGFDFKVGDKKYRYNVSDSSKVKQRQSDLNNFVKNFLGKDGTIENAGGYHRAIWAAENIDDLVTHFYEQGRSDAITEKTAKAKGINMDPRQQRTEDDSRQPGTKVRAVESSDSSKLRFRNFRNK